MGNLTALLILAEAREMTETVKKEMNNMPVTVDARNIPFIKKAIDDTARSNVEAVLRAKFPGASDLNGMLASVTAENAQELIARIVNASSFEEAIGPELDDPTQPLGGERPPSEKGHQRHRNSKCRCRSLAEGQIYRNSRPERDNVGPSHEIIVCIAKVHTFEEVIGPESAAEAAPASKWRCHIA